MYGVYVDEHRYGLGMQKKMSQACHHLAPGRPDRVGSRNNTRAVQNISVKVIAHLASPILNF